MRDRGTRAAPRARGGGRRAAAAALCALAGLAAVAAGAPAWGAEEAKGKVSETRDRLWEINRKLERERQRARDAAKRERDLAQEVRAIEADLQRKNRELKDLQAKLRGSTERIAVLGRESRTAEGRAARSRALLARRLRAIYKQGRLAYVRLLLGADDLSGAATRFKYLASIAAQDRRVVASHQGVLADLTVKRQALETYKAEVAAARETVQVRQHEIAEEQRKRQILLANVREEKLGHLTAARKLEEAARDLQNLITRLGREEGAPRRRTPAPAVQPSPSDGGSFAALKGNLPWPTTGTVASGFGRQENPKFRTVTYNRGIEISAAMGRPVLAVYDGTVLYADWFRGYGRLVVLDHGGGYFTLYAHASELLVKVGDQVTRGLPIARVGDTGSLEGPQLYFEVRHRGKPQDPLAWLERRAP
ncbi:MAG TPA: peptidoglycan DD-metalloendopeptidase family protein [Candidatus Methylomirabilis sp.]|jgi:septal ring factor EnvC (AmiA/AmiB activator)